MDVLKDAREGKHMRPRSCFPAYLASSLLPASAVRLDLNLIAYLTKILTKSLTSYPDLSRQPIKNTVPKSSTSAIHSRPRTGIEVCMINFRKLQDMI